MEEAGFYYCGRSDVFRTTRTHYAHTRARTAPRTLPAASRYPPHPTCLLRCVLVAARLRHTPHPPRTTHTHTHYYTRVPHAYARPGYPPARGTGTTTHTHRLPTVVSVILVCGSDLHTRYTFTAYAPFHAAYTAHTHARTLHFMRARVTAHFTHRTAPAVRGIPL